MLLKGNQLKLFTAQNHIALYKKKRLRGKENKVPKLDIVISHTLGNQVFAKLETKDAASLTQRRNIQVEYFQLLCVRDISVRGILKVSRTRETSNIQRCIPACCHSILILQLHTFWFVSPGIQTVHHH